MVFLSLISMYSELSAPTLLHSWPGMLGFPYLIKRLSVRKNLAIMCSYLAKLTQCLAILLDISLSVLLGRVFLIPQRVGEKR